jgi:hypothetical protein
MANVAQSLRTAKMIDDQHLFALPDRTVPQEP